jgi:hypothetical protein
MYGILVIIGLLELLRMFETLVILVLLGLL